MQRRTAQGKLERGVARPREAPHRSEGEGMMLGLAWRSWRSDGKTRTASALGGSRRVVLVVAVLVFLPPTRVPPRACHPIKHGKRPRPRPCQSSSRDPVTWAPSTPHRRLQPPRPIRASMLKPLQAALLHTGPRRCTYTAVPLILTCTIRTMSTKPSLAAANDFLSFVDASPTRRPRCSRARGLH